MVCRLISLPEKDSAVLLGGVIKADSDYKEGFVKSFLMKIPTIPQLPLEGFALLCQLLVT